MAPLLALAMRGGAEPFVAAVVFAAGMATDMADGRLARSRGLITRFGVLADPIADKLFVGTALVCLAISGDIGVWVVAVVFSRDLAVTGMRFAAGRQGAAIASDQLGKAKTVFQVSVVMVLLVAGSGGVVTDLLVYMMVAITVLSGENYLVGYLRARRSPARRVPPAPAVEARPTLG